MGQIEYFKDVKLHERGRGVYWENGYDFCADFFEKFIDFSKALDFIRIIMLYPNSKIKVFKIAIIYNDKVAQNYVSMIENVE